MRKSPKYYSLGLRLGLLVPSQVQDWVTEEIHASECPASQILDLAYLGSTDPKEMVSILTSMSDSADDFDVLRNLLSDLDLNRLGDIHFCGRLAGKLYEIYCGADYTCPKDLGRIADFDAEFDLAFEGTGGDPSEVHEDFKGFIRSFQHHA